MVFFYALKRTALLMEMTDRTGTKFLVVTDPSHQNVDTVIRKTYEIYADYALKSGFQSFLEPHFH